MKSRSTAILLAIFLGGIGIHKFYLNKPGVGLMYLMFCWTFIPGIIAVFDILGLLLTDDYQFNRLYNTQPMMTIVKQIESVKDDSTDSH